MFCTYFSFVKSVVQSIKMDREEERESLYIEDGGTPSIFRVPFRGRYWRDRGGGSSLNIEYMNIGGLLGESQSAHLYLGLVPIWLG
jgi:hypothetical protein